MAKRDKIIKHIKRLCWANKLETGKAVFKTMRSVFLISSWCHFGCGDLLSYLDACIMPCVLDARLALLYFGVVVRVFSRGVQGWLSVCSSITM